MNFLKMKSPEIVLTANKLYTMTGRITVVPSGVHLPRHMLEISVPNSKGQKTDFMGTILHNNALTGERKKNATAEEPVIRKWNLRL